jgi:Ca2+-transporting ATPase
MAGLALGVQAWYQEVGAAQGQWQTVVFTMLCFVQLGHVLAVRSERESLLTLGLLSNRPLLAAVLIAVALQLAIIYVPALNALFGTQALAPAELGLTFTGAAIVFAAVEVEKRLRRSGE